MYPCKDIYWQLYTCGWCTVTNLYKSHKTLHTLIQFREYLTKQSKSNTPSSIVSIDYICSLRYNLNNIVETLFITLYIYDKILLFEKKNPKTEKSIDLWLLVRYDCFNSIKWWQKKLLTSLSPLLCKLWGHCYLKGTKNSNLRYWRNVDGRLNVTLTC